MLVYFANFLLNKLNFLNEGYNYEFDKCIRIRSSESNELLQEYLIIIAMKVGLPLTMLTAGLMLTMTNLQFPMSTKLLLLEMSVPNVASAICAKCCLCQMLPVQYVQLQVCQMLPVQYVQLQVCQMLPVQYVQLQVCQM